MAKRFTETDIWKAQRWFKKLRPDYKLAFMYIKDQCNHAGIWNVACTDLMEDLGIETFDLKDFIKACNTEFDKISGAKVFKERLRLMDNGYLWITGFIQYQYESKEGIVSASRIGPVKTALQILSGYGVLDEAVNKGYLTLNQPLHNPHITTKDKEEEEDKEEDKEEIKKESPKKNESVYEVDVPRETIDERLSAALDEIYIQNQRMNWRHVDFNLELFAFVEKVRGSPDHYRNHDTGGLRLAFQAQLRNAKKKQPNGKSFNKNDRAQQNQNDLAIILQHASGGSGA